MKSSIIKNIIVFSGLFFLYFPILVLIFYSFNGNKRVMVWKGFSLKWYHELFKNEQIIEAFIVSIKIAGLSATFSTILGVMIGYSLVRIKKNSLQDILHFSLFNSVSFTRINIRSFNASFFYKLK